MRRLLFILAAATFSTTAQATPNFPAALRAAESLPSDPPCSLCHRGETRVGTVTTPFGRAMRQRGLVMFDTGSLNAALERMRADGVDSDGDGISDLDELAAGGNPNDDGAIGAPGDPGEPMYGCSAGGGSLSSAGYLALAALALLAVRRRRASSVLALSLLVSSAALAVTQTGPSSATFTGKGPAGLKLEGRSDHVIVKVDGNRVEVSVSLAKLDTGIDLRNRHMREKYLETDRFPDATLVVDRSRIGLPAEGATVQGDDRGELTLHGRTREVPFHYLIRRENGVYLVRGEVPLNINDFDITVPSYLGITVKPHIDAAVTFRFTE